MNCRTIRSRKRKHIPADYKNNSGGLDHYLSLPMHRPPTAKSNKRIAPPKLPDISYAIRNSRLHSPSLHPETNCTLYILIILYPYVTFIIITTILRFTFHCYIF